MGIQPQITQINADGKTSNPISAFHDADTDNSLPLKLGFFETEQRVKPKIHHHRATDLKALLSADCTDSCREAPHRIPALFLSISAFICTAIA